MIRSFCLPNCWSLYKHFLFSFFRFFAGKFWSSYYGHIFLQQLTYFNILGTTSFDNPFDLGFFSELAIGGGGGLHVCVKQTYVVPFYAPFKNGHITLNCFAPAGRSVDQLMSAQYLLTPLQNLVHWMGLMSKWPWMIFSSPCHRSMSKCLSLKSVVCSISQDPFVENCQSRYSESQTVDNH